MVFSFENCGLDSVFVSL